MKHHTASDYVPRVLFDASNLRGGGAVQVAASLVDEFQALSQVPEVSERFPWLSAMMYRISPMVRANLTTRNMTSTVKVAGTHWSNILEWLHFDNQLFDLQFTVFGPRYGRPYAPLTLTGIADGTSIYPRPNGVPAGPAAQRIITRVRGWISRMLFKRETFLISESESLMQAFHKRTGFDMQQSAVVPNVLNSAVARPELHQPLDKDLRMSLDEDVILLAYVARKYPHKNHEFLPLLRDELLKQGIKATFVLTLTDDEWDTSSSHLRNASINVGPQPIHQIADLNKQCDAVIFPSLLESYSVTPLEALKTNGLLFASDRSFVREITGTAACYFDPLDATEAAKTIAAVLESATAVERLKQSALRLVEDLPTARTRAMMYLNIIDDLIFERT